MFAYIVCGACYLILLIGSLTVWRQRLRGTLLAVVFGAQLAWAAILAIRAANAGESIQLVAAAEYVRSSAWALVLVRWLAASATPAIKRRLLAISALIGLICGLGIIQPVVAPDAQTPRLWGGLALSIAGLVVVEQVVRNTRTGHLWRFKYVWLAVGGLFTWDLFVYSSALLQGGVEATLWVARGFVNALIAAPLLVGVRRIAAWRAAEFLSPRPVFFNATLLGAALYIIAIIGASYQIREQGGHWGPVVQTVFLAAAALVLVVALISEQFRAWTRVTLVKHVLPYRYDYRQEWQKLTRALSQSDGTSVYERISAVMARAIDCGTGGVWLRDAEGLFIPVGGELAPPEAPVEAATGEFFEYLRAKEWIYDLDAARAFNPSDKAPRAPAWMLANSNLWLVVPLVCDEMLVGFVILSPSLAQARLTWEEIDLLRAAGRQIASFLAFEQTAKRLAEARQFEAVNRLSALLMHDLRHLVAQQALVVHNAARHRGNPAFFDDAIRTIDGSVKRMTRLMDSLRTGTVGEQKQRVDLVELCREAVRRCGNREPRPTCNLLERDIIITLNRDSLLHAIEHVIRNAQDATPQSGSVMVEVQRSGQRAVINIKDTGTGMDRAFVHHRLFRPFDTTKGVGGMGIGAYEAREFVRKCGGEVEIDSAPGRGTRFTILLPLTAAPTTKTQISTDELEAS